MPMERIDKLLASTGRWSRREVKLLVKEGRVLVDGVPVGKPEDKADPAASRILVDGADPGWQAYTYIMLNKPAGVVTATEDARQKTVLDLLPEHLQRKNLFSAGRLDKDTEGLLLLTDDGGLVHRLTSPKKHVSKVYYARLDNPLGEEDCRAFAEGIILAGDAVCRPAELRLLNGGREALITIQEGKYHQVKRMTASRGSTVLYLKRLSIGPLTLDPALSAGDFRPLTGEEVAKIGGIPPKS